MRPDGKPEGPRQSMSWLHTYSGLLLGWLLFAVFFTGTFSYFRNEVNDWMRPELHQSVYKEEHSVPMALAMLQERAPDATSWTISLPSPRSLGMGLSWRGGAGESADNNRGGRGSNLTIDASTGEELKPRRTNASSFFYRFHYQLHGVTRTQGRLIVGIATIFMFVAIISGIITHKKIFTDFFTFRPKKGQRSWLDAHNATAVLALPFHIMITFSGLLLIAGTLLPSWGYPGFGRDVSYFGSSNNGRGGGGERGGAPAMQQGNQQGRGPQQQGQQSRGQEGARVGSERSAMEARGEGRAFGAGEGRGDAAANAQGRFANQQESRGAREAPGGGREGGQFAGGEGRERSGQFQREGQGRQQQQGQGGGRGNEDRQFAGGEGRGGQGQQGGRGGENAAPQIPLEKATMVSILPLLAEACKQWSTYGVSSITISNPNTVKAVVQFTEGGGDRSIVSGGGRGGGGGKSMRFDGVSGELIENNTPSNNTSNASFTSKVYRVVTTLHEGRFAGPVIRWLLFLSGVLGTFMAASGMVLWVVKRMPERRKLGRTPVSHRIVEILNIAAIAGLCIAFATLFWMNRLLPADMAERSQWEIDGFFIAWLASAVHALVFSLFCKQRTVWMQQMAVAALMYGLLPILNPLTGGASLLHSVWYGQWSILYVDLALLGMASMHGSVLWWLLRKPAEKPTAAKAPRKPPKAAPDGAAPPVADGGTPAPARRKPPKVPPVPAPIPALAQGEHPTVEQAVPEEVAVKPARRKPPKAPPVPRPEPALAQAEHAPLGGLATVGALAPVLQAPHQEVSA